MIAVPEPFEPTPSEIAEKALTRVYGHPEDPESNAHRLATTLKDGKGTCAVAQFYTAQNFGKTSSKYFPASQWNNLFSLLVEQIPNLQPGASGGVMEAILDVLVEEAKHHPPMVSDAPASDPVEIDAACKRKAAEITYAISEITYYDKMPPRKMELEQVAAKAIITVLGSPHKKGSIAYKLSHKSLEKRKFVEPSILVTPENCTSPQVKNIKDKDCTLWDAIYKSALAETTELEIIKRCVKDVKYQKQKTKESVHNATLLLGFTLDLFNDEDPKNKKEISKVSKLLAEKIINEIQQNLALKYVATRNEYHGNSSSGRNRSRGL